MIFSRSRKHIARGKKVVRRRRKRREKERESILQDRNGIRGNVLSRHDGQLVARSPTNLDRFDKSRECPTRVYTVRREIINYLAYLECYDRDRASNYNPIAARGSTRSRSRENRMEKGGEKKGGRLTFSCSLVFCAVPRIVLDLNLIRRGLIVRS